MADEDEPAGLAWYGYRAAIAWLYAADALCTAPFDGVTNAYKCVEDLLDAVEVELGVRGLCDRLAEAAVGASAGDAAACERLSEELRDAAARVAIGP